MSINIDFHNSAMEKPIPYSFKNGSLWLYTHPSEWDKPMEDAIVTVSRDEELVAIFLSDGMGGHAGGDKAVKAMHESVKKVFESKSASKNDRENVLDAIELADKKVKELKTGAGATIVAFEIGKEFTRSYHAGDSVSYVLGSRGKIKYLSMEHSPRGHALESGLVHEDNVHIYIKDDHEVSNGLGFEPMSLEVSQKIELNNQDLLFLSSDNMPKNFTEEEIVSLISTGEFEKRMDTFHEQMNEKIKDIKKDDTSVALFKYNLEK
tara:strand:- start:220490 stop:221281 length:792 start_codon:yes stop_codon:yes gene_type:complete